MRQLKIFLCGTAASAFILKARAFWKFHRHVFLSICFLTLINGLYAQTSVQSRDTRYFSLDGGLGTSDILEHGLSFGLLLDPKFTLTRSLMLGTKSGVHFSNDRIIALETQAYLRWNFLRLDSSRFPDSFNTTNFFIQGGAGFLGALKGTNVKDSRASLLFDATAGVTIPLFSRWHIEPSIRGGYPFIIGIAVTAGYKFPLVPKTALEEPGPARIETIETIRTLSPNEIIRMIMIAQVDYILFAPNIAKFNTALDRDASSLNELVLNSTAKILGEHPDYRVRIEGHANPVTSDPNEADELMLLSSMRANAVAEQLKARGVAQEQMVVISFGGTRIVASDHDHWNMNRRVEMIIIQVDAN